MSAGQQPGIALVRLLKDHGSNFAGEVCGFPEEIAEELVRKGRAKLEKPSPKGKGMSGPPVSGQASAAVTK